MAGMLPEYEQPFAALFHRLVGQLIGVHAPLLGEIRRTTVDHLAEESVPGAHGGVMGGRSMAAHAQIETATVANADLAVWYRLVGGAARQFAAQQMRYMLESVGRASEQAGTAMDLKGAPLTMGGVLDMLERMHFEVDDAGRPIGLAFVDQDGRDMSPQLARLPMSGEQKERYQRIISEKRRAQDAAKRVRRLDRQPE